MALDKELEDLLQNPLFPRSLPDYIRELQEKETRALDAMSDIILHLTNTPEDFSPGLKKAIGHYGRAFVLVSLDLIAAVHQGKKEDSK